MIKPKVLFICSENSCRTQMAEAFLRDLTGDEFEVVSAGAEAGRLDPEAVTAMREVGIDLRRRSPRGLTHISAGDFSPSSRCATGEKERSCPIFPGAF